MKHEIDMANLNMPNAMYIPLARVGDQAGLFCSSLHALCPKRRSIMQNQSPCWVFEAF